MAIGRLDDDGPAGLARGLGRRVALVDDEDAAEARERRPLVDGAVLCKVIAEDVEDV